MVLPPEAMFVRADVEKFDIQATPSDRWDMHRVPFLENPKVNLNPGVVDFFKREIPRMG